MKTFRQPLMFLCAALGFCLVAGTSADTSLFAQQSSREQLQHPDLKPLKPMRPGVTGPAGYIVLLPIDDRPAVAQFAQMIGAIADHRVVMPPKEMLGRFTTPGNTTKLDEWLRAQDYSKVDALVVSVDMLAYGGLVASRVLNVSEADAKKRLEFFRWFKRTWPKVPLYAFNVLMRVAPTASAETRAWRDQMARWAELKDRVPKTTDANEKTKLAAELEQLQKQPGSARINEYLKARQRDLRINQAMVDLLKEGAIDSLLLLQDDARVYGLHRQDQAVLLDKIKRLKLESRIPIYNGADEGSLSLVARAVLDKFRAKVKVAVVYSSENSRQVIAPYEDHPIEFTVSNQISAAGGVIVSNPAEADYLLYVNAPGTEEKEFDAFLKRMIADLKANKAVALADILFPAPHYSGADERLIAALEREKLFDKFTAWAAWNTAGNTLGTTIPAANLRVFALKNFRLPLDVMIRASVAHYEFLLHRFAGDYLYHDIVRAGINAELRKNPDDPTDEFTPPLYERINRETNAKLRPLVEKFFADHFKGRSYKLGNYDGTERSLKINELNHLKIYLPWPRTFEVTVDYQFSYSLIP